MTSRCARVARAAATRGPRRRSCCRRARRTRREGSVMRFDDRVAFITGGGIGFGRAFARSLAAEGASIVIADIDVAAGDALADELTAAGTKALAVQCDV